MTSLERQRRHTIAVFSKPCTLGNAAGDLVDKRDVDVDRWIRAQGVIRTSGQGKRAWRYEEPEGFKRATRLYLAALALAVLALIVAAVAR